MSSFFRLREKILGISKLHLLSLVCLIVDVLFLFFILVLCLMGLISGHGIFVCFFPPLLNCSSIDTGVVLIFSVCEFGTMLTELCII